MDKLVLTLSLLENQRVMPPGQMPEAIVRLFNEGNAAVLINGRMLLVPGGAPGPMGEVNVDVDGPPGSISLKDFAVRAGRPGADSFISLGPGDYIEKVYALNDYFYYDTPGQYALTVKYHNEIDLMVAGQHSWRGDLVSDTVTFEMG